MNSSQIILFTSDFYPSALVASRRTSFWAQHLKDHLPQHYKLTVITCNSKAQKLPGVDELHILKVARNPRLRKLSNLIQLILHLLKEKQPSTIILSAGPFYFLLASFFISKRHRLIFDLRDPFAGTTNYNVSPIKKALKGWFQQWFIKKPDGVITINKSLKQAFGTHDSTPYIIVPNGFESDSFNSGTRNNKVLVLGKVYGDFRMIIGKMLESEPELEIHQYLSIGDSDESNRLKVRDRVNVHEQVRKEDVPDICRNFSVGLVVSYPQDFVLPVKIFDYLNAGMKILVINGSKAETSEIKNLLKRYPSVFYASNAEFDAKGFRDFLSSSPVPAPNKMTFDPLYFRMESTKALAEFLR